MNFYAQHIQDISLASSPSASVSAGFAPDGLSDTELARIDRLITPRQLVRRGEFLIRAGTDLRSIFSIRSGSMKCSIMDKDGRDQIMGFYLAHELLGMDAVGTGKHVCDVVALEDSDVCKVSFLELQRLGCQIPNLGHHLNCLMSREVGRSYGVMLLLGTMEAEERLVAFLLNLAERYRARGYSMSHFVLRMTRREIGSYLGLKLETVSRMFSRLQRESIIEVQGKDVRILDIGRLQDIMQGTPSVQEPQGATRREHWHHEQPQGDPQSAAVRHGDLH
jgi:CRP/FNR family transcriptional regulator